MKDNNGLEGSVEIGGQEKKYSKDDLRQAFVTGYWLHLDSDNNDLGTRVDKFEKWFNERFGS